jgi:dihydroxyacetone kinase-like protein
LPLFELGTGEIEIGIGIHGEKGIERTEWKPAASLVSDLLDTLLGTAGHLGSGPALLLVNGLGATPEIELYLLYAEAARQLAERGIEISRSLVGSYVTSLNMADGSISLLALDDELTELWDAPVVTPALRWGA